MRTLRPLHDAISVHLWLQYLNCILTRQRFDDEPDVYKKGVEYRLQDAPARAVGVYASYTP